MFSPGITGAYFFSSPAVEKHWSEWGWRDAALNRRVYNLKRAPREGGRAREASGMPEDVFLAWCSAETTCCSSAPGYKLIACMSQGGLSASYTSLQLLDRCGVVCFCFSYFLLVYHDLATARL